MVSGTHNSKGVAILVKRNTSLSVGSQAKDPPGRFLILKRKINKEDYLLANVYGPNNDNPVIFADLFESMEDMQTDLKIIADFNLVLQPDFD